MGEPLFDEILRFDTKKPAASFKKQALVAGLIALWLLVSPLVSSALTSEKSLKQETLREYHWRVKNGVTPGRQMAVGVLRRSLYSSVSEELLFRVIVLKCLVYKLGIKGWQANILQAVVFGSLHMTNAVTRQQGVKTSVCQSVIASVSFWLYGWSFMTTNSIWPALLVHMFGNLYFSTGDSLAYEEFYKQKK
jgi:membrane protease YdiL (CAAX protease family)